MNEAHNLRILIVSVTVSVLLFLSSPCLAQEKPAMAAAALLERFETVFYAEGHLLARVSRGNRASDNSDAVLTPFMFLLGGLELLGSQAPAEILEGSNGVLVGAKDFRRPKKLEGPVFSEFCYVVLLHNQRALDLGKYFSKLPQESAGENPIWRLSGDTEVVGYMYVSLLGQGYLLMSNNISELRATTERLLSRKKDSHILERIRDWSLVSVHEVWGYRRFRHEAVSDPFASSLALVTPGAEALMFSFDSKERVCVLRLINSPRDERTAANIKEKLIPPLKQVGSGVWETTFPLADAQGNLDRIMLVMWLFGFGIFV